MKRTYKERDAADSETLKRMRDEVARVRRDTGLFENVNTVNRSRISLALEILEKELYEAHESAFFGATGGLLSTVEEDA